MTYIEALASGLVVFARYDDVTNDLIKENQNGYLCNDAQEFATKIQAYFAKDEAEMQKMKLQAREDAIKFDSHIFGQKVMSVYHQAISDFKDGYEVVKIRIHDDYVSIIAQNDSEEDAIKVHITLDDYFNYKIRPHMMLDRNSVSLLLQKQKSFEAYRSAIKKLSRKDYTVEEMRRYFISECQLDELDCENLILSLEKKGYLNDQKYVESKMMSVSFSLMGKEKIRRKLSTKGLDENLIQEALSQFDDQEESQKAKTVALKLMNTIKGKSISMKKLTIFRKLIDSGFSKDIATDAIEGLDFTEENEAEALMKTVRKANNLYAKEEPEQRQYKIVRYCMQKGFKKEDIMNTLEGWGEFEE
jgi:1,2-diacylglycerol 3-alpha-glucosyltransferase